MRRFDEGCPPALLARQLADVADLSGRVVMVHASLRRLGPVQGGAAGVVEAVRDALGPEGTMLMMVAAEDGRPFDRWTTRADPENGVLAEVFRTTPGVEVNDNPACRFAALGPLAPELLEPQPVHHYYGPGSPLARLVELDGLVLRLGADPDTVTLTHLAEYLADIPQKRTVRRRYVRADTGAVTIDSLDDSDGIATWEHGDYFPRILVDFLAAGQAATGPAGETEAEVLPARAFVDHAVAWIERHLGRAR